MADDINERLAAAAKERWAACKKHTPEFDAEAARGLTSREVQRRWPRWSGTCECGFFGVAYASYEHYIAGDW